MVWTLAGCNELLYVPLDWEQHGSLPWLSFLCSWCSVWSLGQVARGNSTSFVRSAWLPLTLLGRRQGPVQPQQPAEPSRLCIHRALLSTGWAASPALLGCTWHTDWPSHTRDRGNLKTQAVVTPLPRSSILLILHPQLLNTSKHPPFSLHSYYQKQWLTPYHHGLLTEHERGSQEVS